MLTSRNVSVFEVSWGFRSQSTLIIFHFWLFNFFDANPRMMTLILILKVGAWHFWLKLNFVLEQGGKIVMRNMKKGFKKINIKKLNCNYIEKKGNLLRKMNWMFNRKFQKLFLIFFFTTNEKKNDKWKPVNLRLHQKLILTISSRLHENHADTHSHITHNITISSLRISFIFTSFSFYLAFFLKFNS